MFNEIKAYNFLYVISMASFLFLSCNELHMEKDNSKTPPNQIAEAKITYVKQYSSLDSVEHIGIWAGGGYNKGLGVFDLANQVQVATYEFNASVLDFSINPEDNSIWISFERSLGICRLDIYTSELRRMNLGQLSSGYLRFNKTGDILCISGGPLEVVNPQIDNSIVRINDMVDANTGWSIGLVVPLSEGSILATGVVKNYRKDERGRHVTLDWKSANLLNLELETQIFTSLGKIDYPVGGIEFSEEGNYATIIGLGKGIITKYDFVSDTLSNFHIPNPWPKRSRTMYYCGFDVAKNHVYVSFNYLKGSTSVDGIKKEIKPIYSDSTFVVQFDTKAWKVKKLTKISGTFLGGHFVNGSNSIYLNGPHYADLQGIQHRPIKVGFLSLLDTESNEIIDIISLDDKLTLGGQLKSNPLARRLF